MGDKEKILDSIRNSISQSNSPKVASALLQHDNNHVTYSGQLNPIRYDSPLEKAREMIEIVGGKCIEKDSKEFEHWKADSESITIQGQFLVAENGAIWVELPEDMARSDIFLAEHLIIEVNKNDIVHNMHEAYERLGSRKFGYGTFISGPSKTADIEQSLVIGAQGPRSCTVILL